MGSGLKSWLGVHPPGCVLQSAADFIYLLFSEIHHCQMDTAILAHTHFSIDTHRGRNVKKFYKDARKVYMGHQRHAADIYASYYVVFL